MVAFDSLLAKIGSEMETCEELQLVGQFAVYALYRSLSDRVLQAAAKPDVKLFERLWETQKKRPIVG